MGAKYLVRLGSNVGLGKNREGEDIERLLRDEKRISCCWKRKIKWIQCDMADHCSAAAVRYTENRATS